MFNYLTFSDAAKFALIARNIVEKKPYFQSFLFWEKNIYNLIHSGSLFSGLWTLPIMPLSIAAFFKIFGVNDFAVIATSFFYFFLTLVFVYLLGKKLFESRLVGVLSALAVTGSYNVTHYALIGASESPFMFEIIAASYFATLKKKWANIVVVILLILMYFTRQQAFIYIFGIVIYSLFINFKPKKALIYFAGFTLIYFLIDWFIFMPIASNSFFTSIFYTALHSGFDQSSVASDALRGGGAATTGIVQIAKNVFYNLYNFYKAWPQIMNPYLTILFAIGLFVRSKTKELHVFKISSLLIIMATTLVTAISIPFYRYLHPVIPLIDVIAAGTLYGLLNMDYGLGNGANNRLQNKEYGLLNKAKSVTIINIVSIILVLFFAVGQTAGVFLLDSRFEADTHNVRKAPVYVELSKIMEKNTDSNQVIITNLDTWGTWYGERKTIWFPIEPKQLIDPSTGKIPFDAIYLTSYLIDDANYYMGEDWRTIFENPTNSKKWTCDGCGEIAKEFTLKRIYTVDASEDYERSSASAVLLIKK